RPRKLEVAHLPGVFGLLLEANALAPKPALLHGVPFRPFKTIGPADPHSPKSQEQGDECDGGHDPPDSEPHAGPSHGSLLPRLVAAHLFSTPAAPRADMSGSTMVHPMR